MENLKLSLSEVTLSMTVGGDIYTDYNGLSYFLCDVKEISKLKAWVAGLPEEE